MALQNVTQIIVTSQSAVAEWHAKRKPCWSRKSYRKSPLLDARVAVSRREAG
jgi:hypothetical protein